MSEYNIFIPDKDCKIETFKRQYHFNPNMRADVAAEFMGVSVSTINRWKVKIKKENQ